MTAEQTKPIPQDFSWPADTISVAKLVGDKLDVNWTQVAPVISYLKTKGVTVPSQTLYRGRPRDAWTRGDSEVFEAGARFLQDQGKLLAPRTRRTYEQLVAHVQQIAGEVRSRGK
jgi:hypothetical protein